MSQACFDPKIARRRRGTTYLEIQVAMVLLAISTAGLYSISVVQTKQTARLSGRMLADANTALNPSADEWARKLGVMAELSDAVDPAIALPPDQYFSDINDNDDSPPPILFMDPTDWYGWYHWSNSRSYGGTGVYHIALWEPGVGSYMEQRIDGIPLGNYEILITYPNFTSCGDAIEYEIYDGATLMRTVTVDQRTVCNDTKFDGHGWKRIDVRMINSGTLRIRIKDGPRSSTYAIGDAIAIRTRKFELVSTDRTAAGGARATLEIP